MLTLLIAVSALSSPPQELYKYLAKPDSTFAFSPAPIDLTNPRDSAWKFVSQTWKSGPWQHTILIHQPKTLAAKGTGILYITGDGPRKGDFQQLTFFSEATGMPVAMLFDIPNQPINGMREDDLIAHTFERFLTTGDPEWPLLFPMTKSALRAMDVVEKATGTSDNPIHKFVVTGASKRGWTTWFVGAAKDPRVIGIAPMVYDNLNVSAQLPHQLKEWGKYSEMIEDYTRRGLQKQLETPRGMQLARIIDPYSYRFNIKVPTLVVTGSNDRYWAADATRQYWDDLKQPKWNRVIPNVGHDLGGGILAAESIGAFARSLAGAYKMPKVRTKIRCGPVWSDGYALDIDWQSDGLPLDSANVWWAQSNTHDFRDSAWTKAYSFPFDATMNHRKVTTRVKAPSGKSTAVFMEYRYRVEGRPFSLTTPIEVAP